MIRRIFRLSTLFYLLSAAAVGALLFQVSQNVQQAEHKLRSLQQASVYEEKTIEVLQAEWDYLSRPERLEELSQAYLGLVPPASDHLLGSAGFLPDTIAPVIPGRKPLYSSSPSHVFPSLSARPAVVDSPSVFSSSPAPSRKPLPSNNAQKDFEALLQDLNSERGGR